METKEILVIVLIGIVLLAVGLQTIQLAGLTKTQVVVASNSAPIKSDSTSGLSSTSLQELPSMVGGC